MLSFSMDPRRPATSSSPSNSSSSSFYREDPYPNAMSAFRLRPTNVDTKKLFDITSLMSPPEPALFDNFHQDTMAGLTRPALSAMPAATVAEKQEKRPRASLMMSPPISPATKGGNVMETAPATDGESKDPILYPNGGLSSSPQQPLFTQPSPFDRQIDEHVAAREPSLFQLTQPPSRTDYKNALYFKSEVMQHFNRSRTAWLSRNREQLMADSRARANRKSHSAPHHQRLPVIQPSRTSPKVPAPRVTKSERSAKRTIRAAPTHRATTIIAAAPSDARKRTPPRHRITSDPPEPRRTSQPNREDKDFLALPDYCPPLATLAQQNQHLKVEWKGNAIDLSDDPLSHLLHPEELVLAGGLRLDCATYLTSKRRIFERRLQCARQKPVPKEFRKTDAQQACKIDVNKASKLWQAYDKVGWLHPKHMAPFMAD